LLHMLACASTYFFARATLTGDPQSHEQRVIVVVQSAFELHAWSAASIFNSASSSAAVGTAAGDLFPGAGETGAGELGAEELCAQAARMSANRAEVAEGCMVETYRS